MARKKATKKDPNAPKRPLNAFMIFSQEKRAAVKKAYPDAKAPEVASVLGDMWGRMGAEEKKPYEKEAAALRTKAGLEPVAKKGKKKASPKKASPKKTEADFRDDLMKETVKELKERAKRLGMTGYSTMKKADLVTVLSRNLATIQKIRYRDYD